MFTKRKWVFIAFSAVISASAFGSDVVNDTIQLSKAGVSDDVIQAWAAQQQGFDGSASSIVALKNAKVSDKVILTLMDANKSVRQSSVPIRWVQSTDSGNTSQRSEAAQTEAAQTYVAPLRTLCPSDDKCANHSHLYRLWHLSL